MFAVKWALPFLPNKYIYDSDRINDMVLNPYTNKAWEGSYRVAANIFSQINFLGLSTVYQWSLVIGIIFTTIMSTFLLLYSDIDIIQSIFWLGCVLLLNLYVFTIGKDIIQFILFLIVFLIATFSCLSIWVRIFTIMLIFLIEGLIYRPYFYLVAAFFICTASFILYIYRKNHFLSARKLISIFLLGVALFVMLAAVLFPGIYQAVVNVRSDTNAARAGIDEVNSIIKNVVPGNNVFIVLINYLINVIRMMVPVELLFKGIVYIPFIIFQLLVTIYYILFTKNFIIKKNTNQSMILAYSVFTAFLLVSFFFEPDFGSWLRHEVAAFPILQMLFCSQYCRINGERARANI